MLRLPAALLLSMAVLCCGCSAYQQASADLVAGKYAQATAQYEAILKDNPGDAMAWRKLGYAHYKSGGYAAAINAFNRTLELVPRDPDATFYLGQSLIASGKRRDGLDVMSGYSHPDMFVMAQTISGTAVDMQKRDDLSDAALVDKMERARDVGFARQRIYQANDKGFGGGWWGRLYLPIRNPAAGDDLI